MKCYLLHCWQQFCHAKYFQALFNILLVYLLAKMSINVWREFPEYVSKPEGNKLCARAALASSVGEAHEQGWTMYAGLILFARSPFGLSVLPIEGYQRLLTTVNGHERPLTVDGH